MSYQQDWIMRQIEAFITLIIRLMSKKSPNLVKIEEFKKTALQFNHLYAELQELILQCKICDAENLLFEAIDNKNENALESAILFYYDINKLTDAELQKNNYTREEILSGLQEVCRKYEIMDETIFKIMMPDCEEKWLT